MPYIIGTKIKRQISKISKHLNTINLRFSNNTNTAFDIYLLFLTQVEVIIFDNILRFSER